MIESERQFADFLELNGKTWEHHPKSFRLDMHGFTTYQVDFYCPEDDIYYEVKTKLKARDIEKMLIFKKKYPLLTLKVVSPNGFPFYSNLSGLIFENIVNSLTFFQSKDVLDFTPEDYENHVKHFFSYRSPRMDSTIRIKRIPIYGRMVGLVAEIKKRLDMQ